MCFFFLGYNSIIIYHSDTSVGEANLFRWLSSAFMYAHLFVVAKEVQFSAQVDRINLHPDNFGSVSLPTGFFEPFSYVAWGPLALQLEMASEDQEPPF